MSINILPNQALAFDIDTTNKCNTRFFLQVKRGDNINLQGKSSPIDGFYNKVPEGTFISGSTWTLGANWSISGGSLHKAAGTTNSAAESATIDILQGKLYRLYCEVLITNPAWVASTTYALNFVVFYNGVLYQCTTGNSDATFTPANWTAITGDNGLVIAVNGDDVKLPDTVLGQGCHESFRVTAFYNPSAVNTNTFRFAVNNPYISFKINNAEMVEFDSPTVTAYNFKDHPIYTLTPTVDYFAAPDYTAPADSVVSTTWDMHLNLDSLIDGCCYLVISKFQPIGDPAFQDNGWWTKNGWTFANSLATSTATTQVLTGYFQLIKGRSYTFDFIVNGLGIYVGLDVKIDFGGGTPYETTIVSNGAQSLTFTADGPSSAIDSDCTITINAVYRVIGHSPAITVTLKALLFDIGGMVSNNISFQTNFPGYRQLVFSATNGSNAFDFDYSNGLTHYIRLWAMIKYKGYLDNDEEFNFSDNSNLLMVASQTELLEVTIAQCPEWVHNCLNMMRKNDTFTINGNEYVKDGDYSLQQRKSTDLSEAKFAVKPQQGISKNWAISS